MPARKVCAQPGCPTIITTGSRCQQHRTYSPTYTQRDWAERKRRAQAVTQWVQRHGWWCPGYATPPHPSQDLTAAHTTAVTNGGTNSELQVLCRTCNSRMGTSDAETADKQQPTRTKG